MKKLTILIVLVSIIIGGMTIALAQDEAPDLPCAPSKAELVPHPDYTNRYIVHAWCAGEQFWFDVEPDHVRNLDKPEEIREDSPQLTWNGSRTEGFLTDGEAVIWNGIKPATYHSQTDLYNPGAWYTIIVDQYGERQVILVYGYDRKEIHLVDAGRNVLDAALAVFEVVDDNYEIDHYGRYLMVVRSTGEVSYLELPEVDGWAMSN